uniref:IP04496p n=1 Tax=Drosophila melanogaster TaxID=7227 RepID=Q4V6G9_DROME|nr:IP04496p [Drosophila melanogaster]
MQYTQLLRVLCSIVIISYMAVHVLGDIKCNVCQPNHVKCLNETHFSFCLNAVSSDQVIQCPDGQVCTSLLKICLPKGSTPASCTPDAEISCPPCSGAGLFVCTSRTTFQMCDEGKLIGQVTKCKDNTFCSMKSKKFCVDQCEITKSQNGFECDRESPLDV